jgi:hypothetical protein
MSPACRLSFGNSEKERHALTAHAPGGTGRRVKPAPGGGELHRDLPVLAFAMPFLNYASSPAQ